MNNIKCVISDLDGTLLNSEKQLCKENCLAIEKLRKHNILFVAATGRPLGSVLLNINTWDIEQSFDYVIHTNGYGIYDFKKKIDKNLYPLKKEWCKEIVDTFENFDLSFMDYDGYSIHASSNNTTIERVKGYNDLQPIYVDNEYFYSKDFPKLCISGKPKTIDKVNERCDKLLSNKPYHGFKTANDLFEFVDIRVSKKNSAADLCNSLGINEKQVLVFGDSSNDVEILEFFSNFVAMGNALDSVKKAATYQTITNDEAGFAFFINKYLF